MAQGGALLGCPQLEREEMKGWKHNFLPGVKQNHDKKAPDADQMELRRAPRVSTLHSNPSEPLRPQKKLRLAGG
jgi:hypothetical protein